MSPRKERHSDRHRSEDNDGWEYEPEKGKGREERDKERDRENEKERDRDSREILREKQVSGHNLYFEFYYYLFIMSYL